MYNMITTFPTTFKTKHGKDASWYRQGSFCVVKIKTIDYALFFDDEILPAGLNRRNAAPVVYQSDIDYTTVYIPIEGWTDYSSFFSIISELAIP